MSMDVLLKFLDDPCLRVTPSFCQNDPFEFGYSEKDIEKLDLISRDKRLGRDLKDFSDWHGIVSLASNNSNIMMWSHYANNHTGAVVELIIDEDRPQSLFVNSAVGGNYKPSHSDFSFGKVDYNHERGCNDIESFGDIESIKKHYYFTKAEQWKLEGEYRFITPFNWINRVLLNHNGFMKARRILKENSDGITCLNKGDPEGHRVYELSSSYVFTLSGLNPGLLLELWKASNANEIMFLIRLNSGFSGHSTGGIGKIFLGCQSNDDAFISELNNGQGLHCNYYNLSNGNLRNVFKGDIDKNKYKLIFEEVGNSVYGKHPIGLNKV